MSTSSYWSSLFVPLVRRILEHATAYTWSTTGSGSYRLILGTPVAFAPGGLTASASRGELTVWTEAVDEDAGVLRAPPFDSVNVILAGRVRRRVWRTADRRGCMSMVSEAGRAFKILKTNPLDRSRSAARDADCAADPPVAGACDDDVVYAEVKYDAVYETRDAYSCHTIDIHQEFPVPWTILLTEVLGDPGLPMTLVAVDDHRDPPARRRATGAEVKAMAEIALHARRRATGAEVKAMAEIALHVLW